MTGWLRDRAGRIRRRWMYTTIIVIAGLVGGAIALLIALRPQVNPTPSVVITRHGPTTTVSSTVTPPTSSVTVTHHSTSTAPGPTRTMQPEQGQTVTVVRTVTRTRTVTVAPPSCFKNHARPPCVFNQAG